MISASCSAASLIVSAGGGSVGGETVGAVPTAQCGENPSTASSNPPAPRTRPRVKERDSIPVDRFIAERLPSNKDARCASNSNLLSVSPRAGLGTTSFGHPRAPQPRLWGQLLLQSDLKMRPTEVGLAFGRAQSHRRRSASKSGSRCRFRTRYVRDV